VTDTCTGFYPLHYLQCDRRQLGNILLVPIFEVDWSSFNIDYWYCIVSGLQ